MPVLRCERLHRQGVDLLAHAFTQRLVYELVLLYSPLAPESLADDDGFEMVAVPRHLDVVAGELFLNVGLDLFGGNHFQFRPGDGRASVAQLVAALEERQGGE